MSAPNTARPTNLAALSADINREHQLATEHAHAALAHAHRAGDLLRDAKATVGHGRWSEWIGEHFDGSERTAQRYMRLAKHWHELEAKAPSMADLTLAAAESLVAAPRTSSAYLERLAESGELFDLDLLDLGGALCHFVRINDQHVSGCIIRDRSTATERYLLIRIVIGDGEGEVTGTGRNCGVTAVPRALERLDMPPLTDEGWTYDPDSTEAEEAYAMLARRGRRLPPRWHDVVAARRAEATA